jgi:hypothetical protein
MASEVYMDVPAVRDVAKTFGTISQVLSTVAKVLEALSMTLKTTAFIGLVGGAVVAQFIDMIKPHIDQMSQKCEELNGDVSAAVDAFERGDAQGSQRFY